MPINEGKPKSKLKLRPYGTMPATEVYFSPDETITFRPKPERKPQSKRSSKAGAVQTPVKSSFYGTAVKGFAALLLLAILINLVSSLPFKSRQQEIAQTDSTTTAAYSVDDNQGATSDSNQTFSTDQDRDNSLPNVSDLGVSDLNASSDSDRNDNEKQIANEETRDFKTEVVTATEAPLVTETSDNDQLHGSTTTDGQQQSDNRAPENTLPENTRPGRSYVVNAYRATLFSSLAADAAQTPVARGTAVRVLETHNDWVKVALPESGLNGFIHMSQLRNP